MLQKILLFLSIGIGTLIPIILWGYFFAYIDNYSLNKKRFFLWMISGGISVFPVLYLGDISKQLGISFLNIFNSLPFLASFWDVVWVFLSFVSIFLLFSFLPFVLFYLTPYHTEKIKIYFRRFGIFSIYFWILSIWFFVLSKILWSFSFFSDATSLNISFGDIVFDSLKLVIFYYFIIGILEELSKFLFFSYEKNFSLKSVKDGVLSAIFIALGFAFIENILYFSSLYEKFWFWGELLSSYFLRSLFSVFLHLLCSSIFAAFFAKVYLMWKEKMNLSFLRTLFVWFVLSFWLHAFFDIFISFNLIFFIFLYLIGGYFYFTYLFYTQ